MLLRDLVDAANAAERESRSFILGLSGGSLVDVLAANRDEILSMTKMQDWQIFLIDERYVPLKHPDSNYGQLKERVFQGRVTLHGIQAELSLNECATEYASRFSDVCRAASRISFDLVLMGIGPDGHCASLFPGHAAAEFPVNSSDQSRNTFVEPAVIAVREAPKPPPIRISFTGPILSGASCIRVPMIGDAKKEILMRIRRTPREYPAGRILMNHPDGKILADQAAVG